MTWNMLCPFYIDSTVVDLKDGFILKDSKSYTVNCYVASKKHLFATLKKLI